MGSQTAVKFNSVEGNRPQHTLENTSVKQLPLTWTLLSAEEKWLGIGEVKIAVVSSINLPSLSEKAVIICSVWQHLLFYILTKLFSKKIIMCHKILFNLVINTSIQVINTGIPVTRIKRNLFWLREKFTRVKIQGYVGMPGLENNILCVFKMSL